MAWKNIGAPWGAARGTTEFRALSFPHAGAAVSRLGATVALGAIFQRSLVLGADTGLRPRVLGIRSLVLAVPREKK